MTSSGDVAADVAPDELPGALTSMWRLFKLGYHHEPRLLVTAFVLSLLAAVPDALIALWLALLGKGAVEGNDTLVMAAAIGLGVSATLTWLLRVISSRLQRRFRDRVTIALEGHVAGLQARVVTVAHQERPDYLDRLAVLRDQIFVLDHLYMSVFSTCGWILRLAVTIVLLMSIHWTLALLVLAALPTVLTSGWRPGVERRVQEEAAPHQRRAAHYYRLATTAPSARELRVLGLGERISAGRRTAWESWYVPTARVRWASALWHTVAWTVFGVGFVLAVVWVTNGLDAPVGQVLLVLAAGGRLSGYVGATVGEIGFLRGVWLDGSRRLAWLEDYAALQRTGDLAPPARLESGIRFDGVSFAYPGARDRLVLEDVDLALPAGSVVAVVGENGAGKSTLVKLLTQMYVPTAGRILVDDVSLADIDPRAVAGPGGRRVPGLLPLRAGGPAVDRRRRPAPARRPGRRRRGRSAGPVPTTWSAGWRPASPPSSGRTGPVASTCPSASGRSSPSPAASCASTRCCSCSTSRPPRSTPRPSTPSSSGSPPPPGPRPPTAASPCWSRTGSRRCGWPT